MNGKKRKKKQLVLDSGKVSHYIRSDFGIKLFQYEYLFTLKFNIHNFIFLRELKRNEFQIEDSFHI